MKTCWTLLFCAGCACQLFAADTNNLQFVTPDDHVVRLRFPKQLKLTTTEAAALYQQALEILKSSNFNTRQPNGPLPNDIPATQDGYRATVASGRYLLITFKNPVTVETLGGQVIAREIVIGLNRPDYAQDLYTIDDESRLVRHGKYDGALCVQLMQTVNQIAGP